MNSPWDQLAFLMKDTHKRFSAHEYTGHVVGDLYNPEALEEWLRDKDSELAERLETVIQEYAQTGQWPEVTWHEALLIVIRAEHAIDLLRLITVRQGNEDLVVPNARIPQPILVYWLLQNSWLDCRDRSYPHVARRLVGKT